MTIEELRNTKITVSEIFEKDDCVYEQMTLEEFLKEGNQ